LVVGAGVGGPGSLDYAEAAGPLPTQRPDTWYAVYFTDPEQEDMAGGPDEPLVAALDAARISIEAAMYELDLWSIRDALLRAWRRGLDVRLVTDADYLENPEIQALIAAGIPVVPDRSDAIMHDKFVVIDRSQVWTGSMNFTVNGAYHNDNNLIWIDSPQLARAYLAEFEEMFMDGLFGAASPPGRGLRMDVNGTMVEVYFSPDDGAVRRILELLSGAQTSIAFLAFSFTSDEISLAMLERAEAGVEVYGVFDDSQVRSNTGDEYDRLLQSGLPVYLDANPDKMHHKVIVIDGRIVITGSYNFSRSAETRNDENMLIVFSPEIAGLYLAEVERVFALASR